MVAPKRTAYTLSDILTCGTRLDSARPTPRPCQGKRGVRMANTLVLARISLLDLTASTLYIPLHESSSIQTSVHQR